MAQEDLEDQVGRASGAKMYNCHAFKLYLKTIMQIIYLVSFPFRLKAQMQCFDYYYVEPVNKVKEKIEIIARHTVSSVFTRGRLRLRHFPGKLPTGLLTKSIHEPCGSTL